MSELIDGLKNALQEDNEKARQLVVGSEEHERATKAMENRSKSIAELEEAETKKKFKVFEVIGQWLIGLGALGGVIANVFGIVEKRKTNKELMTYEKEDVMTHKGFDNR